MFGAPIGMGGQEPCFKCKGSGKAYGVTQCRACKGTGYIPASYRPCPRCGGQGQGILKDCRLCDDLCYVTEPWVQCQVCYGKGKQGNLGVLSQDCTACNGIGFTKPGYGVNQPGMGFGGPGVPGPNMYGPHHMVGPHYMAGGPHYAGGFGGPGYGAYPPHY